MTSDHSARTGRQMRPLSEAENVRVDVSAMFVVYQRLDIVLRLPSRPSKNSEV